MFSPFDLIAPIGLGLVAAALCVWGFVKADLTKAKIVCILTAVVFLGSIPFLYAMRWQARKCDYVTSQGVRVRQGKLNRCERKTVEADVQWVLDFWTKQCPKDASLSDVFLVCVDQEKLSAFGRHMRGYAFGSAAVVGYNGQQSYVTSLIRHELSHFAAARCGHPMDEVAHHQLFKDVGLGF